MCVGISLRKARGTVKYVKAGQDDHCFLSRPFNLKTRNKSLASVSSHIALPTSKNLQILCLFSKNKKMSEGEDGSLLRQTLMNVDECFVYKVPPLKTSGGHRAEHWDLANPLQTCGFQVERRGNDLYLLFTTDGHSKLFALAKCQSNPARSVEAVMDR